MIKAGFKEYVGYYIGAIVLLLHLAGFIFLITFGLDLELTARDYVLFLAAVMGLIGVFWSQEMFKKRQRLDHKHESKLEKKSKLREKKEELVSLIMDTTSTFNVLSKACDGYVFLDDLMINSKDECRKEFQERLISINKTIYGYRNEINKNIKLARHIALIYFFDSAISHIIKQQIDEVIRLDEPFNELLRINRVRRNSETIEKDVIAQLEDQATTLENAIIDFIELPIDYFKYLDY